MLKPVPFSKFGRLSPIFQRVVLEELPLKSALAAARLGNLDALKHHPIESFTPLIAEQAAFGGHLRILKYLRQCGFNCNSLQAANYSGRLDILKYVLEDRMHQRTPLIQHHFELNVLHTENVLHLVNAAKLNLNFVLGRAARSGQLELFQRIMAKGARTWLCETQYWTGFCARGLVQFAQYVVSCGDQVLEQSPRWCKAVFQSTPLLRFLVATSPPIDHPQLVVEAASMGYLPSVRFLLEYFPNAYTPRAMDTAASQGHLDVVKYLHATRPQGCTTNAIDEAASNGHLDVVKWLYQNRREGSTAEALAGAAQGDHVLVVQWLASRTTRTRALLGQSALDGSQALARSRTYSMGSGIASFVPTEVADEAEYMVSISGMDWYAILSTEELRWETYSKADTSKDFSQCKDIPSYRETIWLSDDKNTQHLQLIAPNVALRHIQSISAMKVFENKSSEEVRWEDYSLRSTIFEQIF
ncbi:hypothetical protein Ae201684P_009512 [Aphanomyces euteiches]|nr:hypothetical protein Ae201684P_009512 [Aphanomyces euteiches]